MKKQTGFQFNSAYLYLFHQFLASRATYFASTSKPEHFRLLSLIFKIEICELSGSKNQTGVSSLYLLTQSLSVT